MDYAKDPLAQVLAAQYVAGTLRGPAKRRFESLLTAHPALREAVVDWQASLMPLTQVVAPQTPPPRVWHHIERHLRPDPLHRKQWWHRLGVWRGLASAFGVMALALVVLVLRPPLEQSPIVVLMRAADGS